MGLSGFLTFSLAIWGVSAHRVADNHTSGEGPSMSEKRASYIQEKLSIEREVLEQFTELDVESNHSLQDKPKVAFLFLTMKDLQWPSLWEDFFAPAKADDYSIYVHQAALPDPKAADTALPLSQFGAISVPWVKTGWCALFGVEVAILRAALQDKANSQFIFVSDSTVPLKRFDYVYQQLIVNSPLTSKFCLASEATHAFAKQEIVAQESSRRCIFKDFIRRIDARTLKHHQWAVLARQHAVMVVRRASSALEIFARSWMDAAPDVDGAEGCSDEAVPLTAMLHDIEARGASTGNTWKDLTRLGVEQNCLTYVRWRNCFAGTELDLRSAASDIQNLWKNFGEMFSGFASTGRDFMKSKMKRDLNGLPHVFDKISEDYLRKMVRQNFMFARKFMPGLEVTMNDPSIPPQLLSELLPRLWEDVKPQQSQILTWGRLETDGRPTDI